MRLQGLGVYTRHPGGHCALISDADSYPERILAQMWPQSTLKLGDGVALSPAALQPRSDQLHHQGCGEGGTWPPLSREISAWELGSASSQPWHLIRPALLGRVERN